MSSIYISLAGSKNGDYALLEELAYSGANTRWASLKGVQPGEQVLIYCQSPHSAIVATAETTAASKVGRQWPYEAAIGSVTMLAKPITRVEIAKRFPKWPWAKTARGGTRPPENIAEWLWNRAGTNDAKPDCEVVFKTGAGFGDPVNNRKVEVAAVKFTTSRLEEEGYKVTSHESKKVGYDLEARRGRTILHVEVKGVSGNLVEFPITTNEVRRGETDPRFRLFVVTTATSKSPTLHRFTWPELVSGFTLNPLAYMAKQKLES